MTGDEVAAFLGVDVLTIRPRLTECFNRGLIETTGERRPTPRGRTADVWRVRG
jgi:predicted ArsR family transcriptional regulator